MAENQDNGTSGKNMHQEKMLGKETEGEQADIIYKRQIESDDNNEEENEFTVEEIHVPKIEEKRLSKCEVCILKIPLVETIADFLCFECEMYVCLNCSVDHSSHNGIKMWGEEKEKEKIRRKYFDKVMNESEKETEEKLKKNEVIMCDRLKVKQSATEKDCWITALCGLGNKAWVACDYSNSSIKIFKTGNNVLQRCVRLRFEAVGITEIQIYQNAAQPNLVSGSCTDNPVSKKEKYHQSFIAATIPSQLKIIYIDLSEKPASKIKEIETEKDCYDIQFQDGMIFTTCREYPSDWSVYIISISGQTKKKIHTGYTGLVPRLALVAEKVYLTLCNNGKVQCRNFNGEVISEIVIEKSEPGGISADLDNNVFVCSLFHNSVYKLDANLTRYESVLDQPVDCIKDPYAQCCQRNRLFIGHYELSILRNFVTVVGQV